MKFREGIWLIFLFLALVVLGAIGFQIPAESRGTGIAGEGLAGTGSGGIAAEDPADFRESGTVDRDTDGTAAGPEPGAGSGAFGDQAGDLKAPGESGIRIVSAESFAAMGDRADHRQLGSADFCWLQGAPALDAASATVFLPCDPASPQTWESVFGALCPADPDAEIVFQEDPSMQDLPAAVEEGHAFEALLVKDGRAAPFRAVAGGLPILCLQQTDSAQIESKENHEGVIRLLTAGKTESSLSGDPEGVISEDTEASLSGAGGQARSEEIDCLFHIRGNVSSTLDKKPWKLSLVDKRGSQKKVSLLGLRRDDDWILNPLYTDATRVREMTAYALWHKVTVLADHPQASSRMRYVELFLNDACQGLYGLQEPVDKKQLFLSEGDILYKIDRWDREYPYLELYEKKEGELEITTDRGLPCVEIRYPKKWDETADWGPMQAFHQFTFSSGDPRTLTAAGLRTDLDSVVSMSLYCAMTHAMDNNWKNSFLIACRTGSLRQETVPDDGSAAEGGDRSAEGCTDRNSEGSTDRSTDGSTDRSGQKTETGLPEVQYDLYRTIWDLNYVFGDVFVYDPVRGYTAFDSASASSYTPLQDSTYDYETFYALDPSLREVMAAKWSLWRENGINADLVCSLAEECREALRRSGALRREILRWGVTPGSPQGSSPDSFSDMETWIRERFAFLDTYFDYR